MEISENNNNNNNNSYKNYINYKDLQPFTENEDFYLILKKISNKIKICEENWVNNLDSINCLRRLNKFNQNLFFSVFDSYCEIICLDYLNSPRSSLVKLTLILLKEIFLDFSFNLKITEWIDFLIPQIIKKNILDKNFIQEEACKVIENFCKNIHYSQSLVCLLKLIKDKNVKYSNRSYELLNDIIKEYDQVNLIYSTEWDFIFYEIVEISKIKRDPYNKRPFAILNLFQHKLGNDKFNGILEDFTRNPELNVYTKLEKENIIENIKKIIVEGINSVNNSNKSKPKSLKEHLASIKRGNFSKDTKLKEISVISKINKIQINEENDYIKMDICENNYDFDKNKNKNKILICNDLKNKPDFFEH